MPETIIDVQSITLHRNNQVVLKDVTLEVFRSEVLVIIGASGSGKSSFLRCINRLNTIETGTIFFRGEDILTLPILELRQQIGMVFQKTAAFNGTVSENIAFGPQLHGNVLSQEHILKLMQQAALEPGLIDRDAKMLSGGQEQRLSIARALANEPVVLLLDEPTSALDPIATHKIEEILLNLKEDTGLTLIWVSHSIEQARRVADRVLFLERGHVVRCDSADNMLDPETGDSRVLAFASGSIET